MQSLTSYPGRCGDESVSYCVAQLRMVFKPRTASNSGSDFKDVLVYLQPLKAAPGTVVYRPDQERAEVTDDHIEMFRVVRKLKGDGSRQGMVVRLTDIWRYVEMVPRFGKECNPEWNSENACELAKEFYLNCFADKQIYQSVY